jgi:hypothetical protein
MKIVIFLIAFLLTDSTEVIRQFRILNGIDLDKSIIILYHDYASCPKCYTAPASMIYHLEENSKIKNYEVIVAIKARTEKQFKKYREIYGWKGKLITEDDRFRKQINIRNNILLVVIDKNNNVNFKATDSDCSNKFSETYNKLVLALK